MPRLRFLEATPEQAALVARLVRRAFRGQAEALGVNKQAHPYFAGFETADRVRGHLANGRHVVLAFWGDQPVGTVRYSLREGNPQEGWIERLAVLPEHRGRRFGEALMRYAERRLAALGATRVRLAIVKQFSRLQAFYERLGYRAAETRILAGVPFEVLLMEKGAAERACL
jgi:ribosomal protein S18 acetylase RimI-like enzyme